MQLLDINIETWYFVGVVCGLVFMMVYQYWLKHNKDPNLAFDKKYLVPFFVSLIVAVFQVVLEMTGLTVPIFDNPLQAFIAGFILWAGVQEILKAILKLDRIDFFSTA